MDENTPKEILENLDDNMQKLKIDELKVGMVLAENIKLSEKNDLLKNDSINTEMIELLRNEKPTAEIYVYKTKKYYNSNFENSEEESQENEQESLRETVDILEKNFNTISANLSEIFFKSAAHGISTIEDIRKLSKELQEKMTDFNTVIDDIVFYGSGKDTIYRHCVNVAILSNLLGMWIEMDEKKIHLLTYSALLHDIGKTKIDPKILNTESSLSEEEYKKVKSHPLIGYNIVKEINYLDKSVAQGILLHHERLDGSGYPLGLKDDKISQFSRIIAIADVFDAINSNRSYRKKKKPFESLEIIKRESFGKLDYTYCNIFLNHMFNYYIGKNVLLNNNRTAQIIQMNINDLDRPLILLNDNFIRLTENKELDILEFVL